MFSGFMRLFLHVNMYFCQLFFIAIIFRNIIFGPQFFITEQMTDAIEGDRKY